MGPCRCGWSPNCVGDDPALWKESLQAAEDAIQARPALWDGILEEIRKTDTGT
jgi:hypothetical protein